MFNGIKNSLKLRRLRKKWRKNNINNKTTICNIFPIELALVGKASYGDIRIFTWNNESKLVIGNYCSIAPEVTFMLDVEHYTNHISTYPFRAQILNNEKEAFSNGNIIIDDDVWIGFRATILSGVHIGQGAVIAAGAVVTKDIPPYSIVGGIPAKIIKYRFDRDIIEILLKSNYANLRREDIENNIDRLYKSVYCKDDVDWFYELTNKDI